MELGEGVINFMVNKLGQENLRRFLMMHVDPTREHKTRSLIEGGLAATQFDAFSPEAKLHRMYLQIHAASRLALGVPFSQVSTHGYNSRSATLDCTMFLV